MKLEQILFSSQSSGAMSLIGIFGVDIKKKQCNMWVYSVSKNCMKFQKKDMFSVVLIG